LLLAADRQRGLALIELESVPEDCRECPLADTSARPAETIHTITNPNGLESLWMYAGGSVRQQVQTSLDQAKPETTVRVLLAQLPVGGGDAGAPVLNDDGLLVGVVTTRQGAQQLAAYCLDVSELRSFLTATGPLWNPGNAEDYRRRGRHYTHTGQYRRAIAAFTAALQRDAENSACLVERAQARQLAGYADLAVRDCTEALRIAPGLVSAYCGRAAAFNELGQLDQALADCAAALRLNPKCALAFSQRGQTFRLRGEIDRAIADCGEAIWLDPNQASAFFQRGLAFLQKGDTSKAILDVTRAVELEPHRAAFVRRRGDIYRHMSEVHRALADYRQALDIDPRDYRCLFRRGFLLAEAGQSEQALADFRHGLQTLGFAFWAQWAGPVNSALLP
jgi:tetratricopeptide (TPR) repeat protein